jgi:hypothetical protein
MWLNLDGTTKQSISIGGPAGPAVASDPFTLAINHTDPTGVIYIPVRVGFAQNPQDAVPLAQLQAMLTPASPPPGDPWATSCAG